MSAGETITVIRARGRRLAKRVREDGSIDAYAALQAKFKAQHEIPSPGPPPAAPPKRDLFNEETLALLMALKVVASRALAITAQPAADPQAWLRAERALIDDALRSTRKDDFATDILARTREHLDVLFSDATELLPK